MTTVADRRMCGKRLNTLNQMSSAIYIDMTETKITVSDTFMASIICSISNDKHVQFVYIMFLDTYHFLKALHLLDNESSINSFSHITRAPKKARGG